MSVSQRSDGVFDESEIDWDHHRQTDGQTDRYALTVRLLIHRIYFLRRRRRNRTANASTQQASPDAIVKYWQRRLHPIKLRSRPISQLDGSVVKTMRGCQFSMTKVRLWNWKMCQNHGLLDHTFFFWLPVFYTLGTSRFNSWTNVVLKMKLFQRSKNSTTLK